MGKGGVGGGEGAGQSQEIVRRFIALLMWEESHVGVGWWWGLRGGGGGEGAGQSQEIVLTFIVLVIWEESHVGVGWWWWWGEGGGGVKGLGKAKRLWGHLLHS